MTNYKSVAAWDSDLRTEIHMPGSVTVYENDGQPRNTGVLDASGTPIYRFPSTIKLGFHTEK